MEGKYVEMNNSETSVLKWYESHHKCLKMTKTNLLNTNEPLSVTFPSVPDSFVPKQMLNLSVWSLTGRLRWHLQSHAAELWLHIVLAQLYLSVHFLLIESEADSDETQGCVSVKSWFHSSLLCRTATWHPSLFRKAVTFLKKHKVGVRGGSVRTRNS